MNFKPCKFLVNWKEPAFVFSSIIEMYNCSHVGAKFATTLFMIETVYATGKNVSEVFKMGLFGRVDHL